MKIIPFQSAQSNEDIAVLSQPQSSLLVQYRGCAKDETLAWVTFAICGVISIFLCLGQLQSDIRRVEREHAGSIDSSRLAEKTVHVIEISRAM